MLWLSWHLELHVFEIQDWTNFTHFPRIVVLFRFQEAIRVSESCSNASKLEKPWLWVTPNFDNELTRGSRAPHSPASRNGGSAVSVKISSISTSRAWSHTIWSPPDVGRDMGDLYAESGQTWKGSFSAVSKPNFASKYALESYRRDLHNALLCTVL